MANKTPRLGDVASSEQLIRDIYIQLRQKLRAWSAITHQTAQARMGYVGQHLVSVATGFPGGKSGARGVDLRHADGSVGEIKTCYRVDQLGKYGDCEAAVAPDETICLACGSVNLDRKDDSKWLIPLRNKAEFAELLVPKTYYLALFEFADLATADTIRASIWTVNPRNAGFVLCIVDYFMNIRAASKSKAPFNLWPYSLKFELMKPNPIYRSAIMPDDTIATERFPGRDPAVEHPLSSMTAHARTRVDERVWKAVAKELGGSIHAGKTKREHLVFIESRRPKCRNAKLCDILARELYRPLVARHVKRLPPELKGPVKAAITG